jgi:putative tricarboxylic transport membrane protein
MDLPFDDLARGFVAVLGTPDVLALTVLGAFVGVIAGAIPGLTTAAAIAMLLPLTFLMSPLASLTFIYVISKAGRFGGSISAILFNTPGTSAAAATQFDGHPMAQQGRAVKAMKIATMASVFGDLGGDVLLIFFAAAIAAITITMGPPEYFAIYVMAFVVIGSVVSESIVKGLISVLLGMMMATVGLDRIAGVARYDFGITELLSGINLVPLLIGTLVLSEVFLQAEKHWRRQGAEPLMPPAGNPDDQRVTAEDVRHCLPVMARSTGIGAVIGLLPGLGSAVACFIAYGEEKRRARRPALWGRGAPEGIAAPESANNAVSGPSMVPVLTLGIPGSTIAAMLMGVFLIHGIQVGPTIFVQSKDLVYALFAAGLIGILCYGLIGWYLGPVIGQAIGAVPQKLIYPTIFLLTMLATYSLRNDLFDLYLTLAFAVLGYAMRRTGFSPPAFIIAFVLAGGAEQTLRQTLLMSTTGWSIFVERPWALFFLGLGLAGFLWRGWSAFARRRRLPA